MALKRDKAGRYIVKTVKDATEALMLMQTLKKEIEELEEEHGIGDMRTDAVEAKKAAEAFMVDKQMDVINLPDGSYGRLRQDGYNRRWILEDDELPSGSKAKSLRKLIKRSLKKRYKGKDRQQKEAFKEIWSRVTKRVADTEGIDEVIAEGLLEETEISDAFVEDKKKPFLMVYENTD